MKKICLWILIIIFPLLITPEIYKLKIEGPIDSITDEYMENSFATIKHEKKAKLIIIELNTPGGFDTSMRKVIIEILNSPAPVAVYVSPKGARAASAGFFITIASDIASMAPGTNMGAAHPVSIIPSGSSKGDDKDKDKESKSQDEIMNEKVTNDAASYIKSLAKSRNRNIKLSEDAVRKSKSYTAEECLKNNLIEYIAEDIDDLINQLDGKEITRIGDKKVKLELKGEKIVFLEMSGRQKFLRTISNPTLAFLLLMLGLAGLFIEFTHPGIIIPGVLGAILLILAFMAFQLLPINYIGLLLILLSIGFFIAEIKIQGFGMFGIGGVISFVLGSVILVKKIPIPEMRPSMSTIIIIAIGFGGIFLFLAYKVYNAMKRKTETGQEALTGKIGVAKTGITSTSGRVFVHGEWWNAVSDEDIPEGSKVKIESIKNFVLKVKKTGG